MKNIRNPIFGPCPPCLPGGGYEPTRGRDGPTRGGEVYGSTRGGSTDQLEGGHSSTRGGSTDQLEGGSMDQLEGGFTVQLEGGAQFN